MPISKSVQALALFVAGLAWLAPALASQTPERLVWRHVPLSITLKTGHERILRFPRPVTLGLPPDIHQALRAQIVDGTIYLLARKSFPPTRVIVKSSNGAIYLIDLAANANGGTAPVVVTDAAGSHTPPNQAPEKSPPLQTASRAASYVALTRFAAQALYAPSRLITNAGGYTRVPLNTSRHVDLIRHAAVDAEPLIGWQAGGLFVTAVKLTNRGARPIILDPRELRGRWRAATFQHARLLPHGTPADTTAVYLISALPFSAALQDANPWRR